MAGNVIPPPPAGYTVVNDPPGTGATSFGNNSPAIPAPPSGYSVVPDDRTIDYAGSEAGSAPQKDFLPPTVMTPVDVAKGAGEGLLKTAVGVGRIMNSPGDNKGMEQVLNRGQQLATPGSQGEQFGQMAEEMAEWAAGDEALKGVVKLAATPRSILDLIEKYPTASKMILATAKGASIGGAQGAVKSAGEGKSAKEGAIEGAEGGAAGSLLAELGISGAQKTGEALGIGRDSLEEATKAGKPGKRNIRWEDDWNRALPHLADRYDEIKGKGVEGVADAALSASNDLWNSKIEPIIEKHAGDTMDVQPVADAVRKRITPSLTKLSPDKAKAMEDFANLYAGPGPKSQMSVGEIEKDIEHLNADLSANGWWKKSAPEREAAIKSGQEDGMKALAADELRNQVYNHIESFKGPDGQSDEIRELKKTYGALRNVENEFRGQVNVQNRQSTISLKKILGMTAGAAAGGPKGAVAAAIPYIDSAVNNPNAMAERAVRAGIPESKLVTGAKAVAGGVARTAAGVGGEHAAQWITVKGGDGETYVVHPEDLAAMKERDPKLQEVSAQ